jgi:hypothetical protein
MIKKSLKDQLSEFIYVTINLYSNIILQNWGTVTNNMLFSSPY